MAKEKAIGSENATEVLTAPVAFQLPKRNVKVIPVDKKSWLPKKHEASFLYKHAFNRIGVARKSTGGSYVNPLTPEEASANAMLDALRNCFFR